METLPHAPCPHCVTLNCVSNVACHGCGRHLCDSNPFSPDAGNRFWAPIEAPQGTTDSFLQRVRDVRHAILAWIGQEDRLLLIASFFVSLMLLTLFLAVIFSGIA